MARLKHIGEEAILSLSLEVIEELIKAEEAFVKSGGCNDTLRVLQYLRVLALREANR